MYANRLRQESFKNVQELIREIGKRDEWEDRSQLMVESQCSVMNILKESRLYYCGRLFELFDKYIEVEKIAEKKEVLSGLRLVKSKVTLAQLLKERSRKVTRATFGAIR